jgi:hypothetical protein
LGLCGTRSNGGREDEEQFLHDRSVFDLETQM